MLGLFAGLLLSSAAFAQDSPDGKPRDALLEWDQDLGALYLSLGFRDVIDSQIQDKLSRGLPTTIVLTAALYRAASTEPFSTTAHPRCRRVERDPRSAHEL
ncbi:MAG TPA: hypothetical protein VFQ61_07830, partial [Polyangiaceae bacterium]|nr:hypothetical protein [Polyangiaceae bacterium]